MRRYNFRIPVGEALQMQLVGNYVRVESAAVALVVEDPDQQDIVWLESGDDATFAGFRRLNISHAAVTAQDVVILVGKDTKKGSSRIGGVVAVTKSTALLSMPDVSCAPGVATPVDAASSLRREVIVGNREDSVVSVRVGDALVAANRGAQVAPGSSITLQTTAEIRVFNPHTAAQFVTVLEVND